MICTSGMNARSVASRRANPFTVPYNFENIIVNKFYEIEVGSIYDPSKLWVTIKNREYKQFSDELNNYYMNNKKLVATHRLRKQLTCIIQKNNTFHRAVFVKLLGANDARIFMLDEGLFLDVLLMDIFCIKAQHCTTPRFALRACLAGIAPPNKSQLWQINELHVLTDLIANKKCYVTVEMIDRVFMVLYIDIYNITQIDETIPSESISSKMKELGKAIAGEKFERIKNPESTCTCNIQYPYLYPTFEALESGLVPSSMWEHKMVQRMINLEGIVVPGYKLRDLHLPE